VLHIRLHNNTGKEKVKAHKWHHYLRLKDNERWRNEGRARRRRYLLPVFVSPTGERSLWT